MTREPGGHTSDELVATLQQLQRSNDVLRRELGRQSQRALDAELRLEHVNQSRWQRLRTLIFGADDGWRWKLVVSLLDARRVWKHFGPRHALRRGWLRLRRVLAGCDFLPPCLDRPFPCLDHVRQALYDEWIVRHEPDEAALERQRQSRLPREPLISVVVPVHRTPLPYLLAMLESVLGQTYANWELCLADGGSADPVLRSVFESVRLRDDRIRVRFLETNQGIAENTNAALALATGEYVAFLDHDDALAPFALFEVARALNDYPEADLLYSDEDQLDETGSRRFEPFFKPAFSPDTLRSYNYVCHLVAYRRDLLEELGGLRTGFDGAQDHDLVLRASEQAKCIVHIPRVLYHWRNHAGSTARRIDLKPAAGPAARRAVAEHLARRNIAATVAEGMGELPCDVRYALPRRPLVSVLIPNKDSHRILATCLKSLARSTYGELEILIIENNSVEAATFDFYEAAAARDPRIRVLTWSGSFNYAAMHNWAARQARGEILLLLNNDVEPRHPDWIERILEHALREEVGAVGAKLFYPDRTIQHAGVVVGLGGVAGHGHRGYPGHVAGVRHRLLATQNVSAVTAACLMLRKDVFCAVDGFDERFAVAFNDVDLCLRIRQIEKDVVWTPFARLWHAESLTRGPDDTPKKQACFAREVRLFCDKWAGILYDGDPFYNPNLSLRNVDFTPDPQTVRQPRSRATRVGRGLDPSVELAETFARTPRWQQQVPHGLTRFGWDELRAWVGQHYGIHSPWVSTARRPDSLRPAEELLWVLRARPDVQASFPDTGTSAESARTLARHLAGEGRVELDGAWWQRFEEDLARPRAGVNLLGHLHHPSGLQVAARNAAAALRGAGWAVSCRDVPILETDRPGPNEYLGLHPHHITISHLAPEPFAADCYARAGLASWPDTYRIGYWAWELERVPTRWRRHARWLHELWAPTRFVAEALRRGKLGLPVYEMLAGIGMPPIARMPRAELGLPERHFLFLFVFDMCSSFERKNPLAVVRAFRRAFRREEPAALAIKVSRGHVDLQSLQQLHEEAGRAGAIVIDRILPEEQLYGMMNACDCYVSLHRSEGFGLTMAEAMALGKPVIATGYSGNLDFMTPENSLLVDYRKTPLTAKHPIYPQGWLSALPSEEHAAALMRKVYEHQPWGQALGQRASRDVHALLSLEAAGRRMTTRLDELLLTLRRRDDCRAA